MTTPKYLRRDAAAAYLQEHFGFKTRKTLAKLASTGGGPPFFRTGAVVLYEPDALREWALSKMSGPFRSTSEAAAA